jgi:hypothetical protein
MGERLVRDSLIRERIVGRVGGGGGVIGCVGCVVCGVVVGVDAAEGGGGGDNNVCCCCCLMRSVWTRAARMVFIPYWSDEVINAEVMNAAGTVRGPPGVTRRTISYHRGRWVSTQRNKEKNEEKRGKRRRREGKGNT